MDSITSKVLPVSVIALGLTMAGCSTTQTSESTAASGDLSSSLMKKDQTISSLESRIGNLEGDLARERSISTDMQAHASQSTMSGGDQLLPPNAKAGECYARVFIPPQYRTDTEQVLRSEASERLEIIPAKFETGQEEVLVKEASERLELIPATYGMVEERVLVKPASTRLVAVPAEYKTETEKVLDKPEHTIWKKGSGPISKIDESTGEIMCLVTIPASYKTISKRVLVSPPSTREDKIPAAYKTVKKRVMLTPPETRKIVIPAEYKTVKVTKMVSPADSKTFAIPAKYETLTKRSKVSDGYLEWRSVLCETNISNGLVQRLQTALDKAGQNPGVIDGILGWRTLSAVKSYQKEKGLPTGGLTMKTLDSLGVKP